MQRCNGCRVSLVGQCAASPCGPYVERMRSVLLVASDPHLSRLVRWVLAEAGMQVVETDDLAGAAEHVRAERPDAVVFDTGLPDIIRATAIEMIRGHVPGVPVVILDDQPTDPVLARQADAILHKPFHADSLIEAMREVLQEEPA